MLGAGFVLAGMSVTVAAGEPKVGDKAPEFSLQGSDGKTHCAFRLQGQVGRRDRLVPQGVHRRLHQGMQVVRAGRQGPQGSERRLLHRQRRRARLQQEVRRVAELRLPHPERPDKDVAKAYGVVHEGRAVPERWTFYIDKEGTIRAIEKKIDIENAAVDAAAKLKELGIAEK